MLEDVLDRAIKKERREGKLEARNSMIIQMIKNNLNDTLIKAISGANDKELEKIKSEMK